MFWPWVAIFDLRWYPKNGLEQQFNSCVLLGLLVGHIKGPQIPGKHCIICSSFCKYHIYILILVYNVKNTQRKLCLWIKTISYEKTMSHLSKIRSYWSLLVKIILIRWTSNYFCETWFLFLWYPLCAKLLRMCQINAFCCPRMLSFILVILQCVRGYSSWYNCLTLR